jgi:hypothetical protein
VHIDDNIHTTWTDGLSFIETKMISLFCTILWKWKWKWKYELFLTRSRALFCFDSAHPQFLLIFCVLV